MDKKDNNWFKMHPIITVILLIFLLPVIIGFIKGLTGSSKEIDKEILSGHFVCGSRTNRKENCKEGCWNRKKGN